jgi:hypothetical protein
LIAIPDDIDELQRIGVQAAGIQHEEANRQAQPCDGVGDDHVLRREAARQHRWRVLGGDFRQKLFQRFSHF